MRKNQAKKIWILLAVCFGLLAGLLYGTGHAGAEEGKLKLHFIDVNHGDSTLVECDGQYMLVDGGPLYEYNQEKESWTTNYMGEIAFDYILDQKIPKLNYMVATHPHVDHLAGLVPILEGFQTETLFMPEVSTTEVNTAVYKKFLNAASNAGIACSYPTPGTQFMLGGATVTVLAPKSSHYDDVNNYSIVLRIVYGDTSFLLTADALKESEAEMMEAGYDLKSDVLRVPHHSIAGVTASSTDHLPFIDAVSPKYSVISNNILASWTILGALRKTSDVYTTYGNGNILMESDGTNITTTVKKGTDPTYYAADILKVENESSEMGFVGEGGDGSVKVYYKKPTSFTFSGYYGIHNYSKIEYMAVRENDTYDAKGTWTEGDSIKMDNGFRGRIFVRFLNEQGKYVTTKTNGFAVDTEGMSEYQIVCNKNARIKAVRVGRVNKKPYICRKKTTLSFSAIFGASGKKSIAYQIVPKGTVYDKEGKWIAGSSVVLKKGFSGNVYVRYMDNCGRVKYKKTQWFKITA